MERRSRSGRRYDREFKQSAVGLVRSGRSITEVARDLGVSTWSLGRWTRGVNLGQPLTEPKTLSAETRAARAAAAAPAGRLPGATARHFKKSCRHLIGRDAAQQYALMESLLKKNIPLVNWPRLSRSPKAAFTRIDTKHGVHGAARMRSCSPYWSAPFCKAVAPPVHRGCAWSCANWVIGAERIGLHG